VLNAVANALRISAEHNWSVFMFVSGAANDMSDSDLQDQVTKLTRTAMTFRLICIDNCCRSEPVPALSSRKPRIL